MSVNQSVVPRCAKEFGALANSCVVALFAAPQLAGEIAPH